MWAWFLACDEPKATGSDDADQDGFSVAQGDCDDGDAAIRPDAVETCDGVDEDCDGLADDGAPGGQPVFVDADGDGFGDPATEATPCEPPADAVLDGTDCDDADRDVFPGAAERCNGRDDDCDPTTVDAAEVDGAVFTDVRAAVEAAPSGGVVALCDGEHPADGVRVTRDLTITSAAGDRARATLTSAGLEVTAGTLTLRAVTLTGAVDGAVRAAPGTAVVAEDVAFVGNAGRSGAALYGFDVTVRDSELADNHASEYGGAVLVDAGGSLVVERTTFSANVADLDGGGVHVTDAAVSFVDVVFLGNSSVGSGGGAWVGASGGSVALTRSTFSGNAAVGEGGGLYTTGCSVSADAATRFEGNFAVVRG
ncbi:MAG: MopE-related protein, partial [Myxococcota bacterium]